ncbi:fimbrial protein [Pantoea sp. 1.19]|uniref:fimbrial protein n=1 Tax=Pantoea sp. 1.19 TaxID=1925589 RepID=UPI000948E52B|nr:fimbrial protein [Pantoea sp. 1.19]
MQKPTLSLLTAGALCLFTAASSAAIVTPGGSVKFEGEIVNGTCAVDADSVDQTVQMGQVRTNDLSAESQVSGAKGFNIVLKDCGTSASGGDNPTTAPTVSIIFSGVSVPNNANILSLQNGVPSPATNVGIQILDRTGAPVALDGSTASAKTTLLEGTNVIPFQARYYALGQATAGTANADATFSVQYD